MCKLAESRNDLAMWDLGIRHLAQAVSIEPKNVFAWAAAATHYMAMGYQSMAMRCMFPVSVPSVPAPLTSAHMLEFPWDDNWRAPLIAGSLIALHGSSQ